MLKAAVEVHIFFLVSIALVIKCLHAENAADELLPEAFYDVVRGYRDTAVRAI
jgi:hypothetical protein